VASHASAEVRRGQILLAAQSCFSKTGYHKTKMDDIVAAAGLSKGSIYLHFKSKDDVFLALFDEFERQILSEWDDLADESALETLRRESEIVLDVLLADRGLVEMWSEFLKHPLARERFAEVYRQSRTRLGATIEAGIDAGELRPCDPLHAAAALTALIEGLLLQALADPEFDPRAAWPTSWEIASGGLAVDASQST
jgi:AcrR family transcriptional regulator